MPLLRTDTGCRCRKTFVSITTTRLRRSRGAGWRKMLFQTWELRMKSPTAMFSSLILSPSPSAPQRFSCGGDGPRTELHLDERFRVAPFAAFLLELLAHIDDDLAVLA